MTGFPNSQSNPAAAIPVWLAPAPGALQKNITTSTGTLIKTGPGVLLGLSINTGQSGATVKLYDGIDNSGTLLGTWSAAAQNSVALGWSFVTGLYAVTAGGSPADITVSYL